MLRRYPAALAALVLVPMATTELSAQTAPRARPERPSETITPTQRNEKQFPLGAVWTLVTINGKSPNGERPSLVIDEQLRGKGFSGCNTFSATAYPLREQSFVVGPIAVTKKACDGSTLASERAFLVAFRGVRKWDIVNGQLVMSGTAGELRFDRAL